MLQVADRIAAFRNEVTPRIPKAYPHRNKSCHRVENRGAAPR